ncbi:hypothetical protein ROZALSC1DRAFT_28980, partial [Rozella allomycis CSF55]
MPVTTSPPNGRGGQTGSCETAKGEELAADPSAYIRSKGLNVCFLNIKGYNDRKLTKLLSLVGKDSVLVLAESHLSEAKQRQNKLRWSDFHHIHAPYTSAARGISVFVRKNNKFNACLRKCSEKDGRLLVFEISLGETKFKTAVVYAPNGKREKREFFSSLTQEIEGGIDLLLGDFNCVLDPRDRNQNTSVNEDGSEELAEAVNHWDLVDGWRLV